MASVKADRGRGLLLKLDDFEPEEGWVAVAAFERHSEASDAGLSILAMGDAYWMVLYEGCYVICVVEDRVAAVCAELNAIAALESNRRRGHRFEYQEFDLGWCSFVLYAAVLIACFVCQGRVDIVTCGKVDAVAMVDGQQWWRAVTALTLHADVVHLVANLISGMGFTFFVCRFFGAAVGWLLVVLSGVAGNILNAMVYYPEPHTSIGASTAVFGALGLLTGVGLWAAVSVPDRGMALPRWLVPLLGGLTLLGLFGVGEGNVDVAAHISGFVCGVSMGTLGASVQPWLVAVQRWALLIGGLSLLFIGAAWWYAVAL